MKKVAKIWIGSTIFGGAVAGGGTYWYQRTQLSNAPSYQVLKPERGDIVVAVQGTGSIQPENRLAIKAPINGRIEEIKVREGETVKKGQVLAYMSSTDRAALLDVARAKGDAEFKHWEDIYRATPLVAPMAGVIIARNIEPGQTINTQDSIIIMSDRLIVVAPIDETDIAKVKLDQVASIVVDAYPNESVNGHVQQIAYEAKTVNNVTVYDVQVIPDQVPDFMRSGMSTTVTFKIEEKKDVIKIPRSAVKFVNGKLVVLLGDESSIKNKDFKPEERPVLLGLSDGRFVEVLSGLTESETIVEETLKLPAAKNGGSPFSPMGGGPQRGGPRSGTRSGSSAHP